MRSRARLATCGVVVAVPLLIAGAGIPGNARAATQWKPDNPSYDVLAVNDIPLTMSDGVVLRANVGIPVPPGAKQPDPKLRFPVLIEQTPYRKDGGLFTVDPFFVQRGYAMVVVDVRGTGSSQGQWESFGAREQQDGPAIVRWAAHQSWANGTAGLMGASYLAINQLLTMEQPDAPSEVKAIFPVVPMGDAYRDVTYHGGNLDAAFIPPWLGLVTALGAPPANQATDGKPADAAGAGQVLADHAKGAAAFQVPQTTGATTGGPQSYDGDFSRVRSPIYHIKRVHVPTFIVGGEFDIFQRAEPMLYNALDVPAKRLIIGPWIHLEGSTASSLPADNIPDLKTLQLQWFDQYLRGQDAGEQNAPRVLQYELKGATGSHFVASASYPLDGMHAINMFLGEGKSGSATSLNDGTLVPAPPSSAGSDQLPYNPTGTGCTRTTFQWGDASASMAPNAPAIPCENDERLNEVQELTYTTPVLDQPLTINGPINVHLIAESPQGRNLTFSVHLTDVDASGQSTQITAGWLLASLRQTTTSPFTLKADGRLLRVFHPFTQDSEKTPPATPTAYDIEVFPTFETFAKGHRIRLDIGTGDAPHMSPSVPHQAGSLGAVFTVDRNPANPSYVTLPAITGKQLTVRAASNGDAINVVADSIGSSPNTGGDAGAGTGATAMVALSLLTACAAAARGRRPTRA
ncbi:MAG TPA: CocE/NonD family hydrolase [Candidatus Dormibacteraeota bacterium]|nr:CocE/NonD family hydrolase [Candidatus Dormibacteraeota bacterium]